MANNQPIIDNPLENQPVDIKTITKSSRFEIIKPIDSDWKEFGKTLNEIAYLSTKIANLLVSYLWNQDVQRNSFKAQHGEYPKERGINTYQLLREHFPTVGTSLISQIDRVVQKKYKSDRKAIFSNKKALSTYKSMPIYIHNQAWDIRHHDENSYIIDVRLLPKEAEQSRYKFIIKYKNRGHRNILERLAEGEYKKGMLSILRDKHNKWYAVPTFSFEKEEKSIKESKTLYVDMTSEGINLQIEQSEYIQVVPIDDIQQTLVQFRNRQSKIIGQRNFRGEGRIGHGRKALFKPQQNIETKMANFKSTKNHNLSRYVVNYASRFKCTDIVIRDKSFISDWTVFDLCTKINNKSMELGIHTVEI